MYEVSFGGYARTQRSEYLKRTRDVVPVEEFSDILKKHFGILRK